MTSTFSDQGSRTCNRLPGGTCEAHCGVVSVFLRQGRGFIRPRRSRKTLVHVSAGKL